MLDVSDGLLRDAGRLARASGVGVELDPAAFAGDLERLRAVAGALGVVGRALGARRRRGPRPAGHVPAGAVLPEPFRVVGRVVARGRAPCSSTACRAPARSGWDHFAG